MNYRHGQSRTISHQPATRHNYPFITMTTADKLTLATILILLPFIYLWAWQSQGDARWLKVTQSSEEPQFYALDEARTLEVSGPMGTTIIRIEAGKARFVSSPCPNKLCVHSGWLKEINDFAACLPNRISMIFAGDSQTDRQRIDSVNY